MRRPNWTEEESLLLAQLIEERKEIIKRKCHSAATSMAKRQAWEEIAQTINIGFPQYQRTVADCEDLSPTQLSDVTQIVLSVMNLSVRMDEEMKDPSILLLSETQQSYEEEGSLCNTEPLTENGHHESTGIRLGDPFDCPEEHKLSFYNSLHHSPVLSMGGHSMTVNAAMPVVPLTLPRSIAATPPSPGPSQHTMPQERMDLEVSVLRRQEAVLKLQEEYYSLKIKLLKKQNGIYAKD
ncbi:hypothetical protein NHX12_030303 [Muraenolepis orangiensis]|uniref:Myb-like domain-containing protein n=1 Tax=Muraenolepis orangiensis TaxID=630683 RepID=A0A9Q0EB10_9TELE|nr:hypothetical protein NHX12_030303 [Muraenolepis orangiensis]